MTLAQQLAPALATRREARTAGDADADIVGLAASGDAAGALRRLMQRHGTAVYRFCSAALHDDGLAEDVHQQVFVEAFRDLPRFGRRSHLRAWLFAIAHHRVLDAAKKRRRARNHVEDGADADAPDPGPSAAESLDDARLRAALVASVDELPEDSRTALLLRYQQGFSFSEMADICREQPKTLCARVARALPQLRKRIEARIGYLI